MQVLAGQRKLIEINEENKEPVNKNIDKQKRFVNKMKKVDSLSGSIEMNEKSHWWQGWYWEKYIMYIHMIIFTNNLSL